MVQILPFSLKPLGAIQPPLLISGAEGSRTMFILQPMSNSFTAQIYFCPFTNSAFQIYSALLLKLVERHITITKHYIGLILFFCFLYFSKIKIVERTIPIVMPDYDLQETRLLCLCMLLDYFWKKSKDIGTKVEERIRVIDTGSPY